jgi:L-lactate utilization protein LutB
VKFIAFFEYSSEDIDKLTPKFQKWSEELKKNPEKHIKYIFPPHYLSAVNEQGNDNGIAIFEADDEEKLIDYINNYWPEMKMRIVPLLNAGKNLEMYLKMKK